jgi:hypothetical protein
MTETFDRAMPISVLSGDKYVRAVISGQPVQATVSLSGLTLASNVSGNKIRIQGFDPSGNTWNDLIVNQSGGNVLRVDAGSISVASNISGQVVYLVSGQNPVQVSGQTVIISGQPVLISGQLVAVSGTVAASVSGNMVSVSGQPVSVSGNVVVANVTTNISGQVVYLASGNNAVQNSGQISYPVSGLAFIRAFDPSGITWNDVWVDASGSHFPLVRTSISGNMVFISGQPVLVSGQLVSVSGLVSTSVSGNMVSVSGQPVSVSGNLISVSGLVATSISGNMVSVSGQPVSVSGNLVSVSGLVATSISGNQVLTSVSGNMVSVSGQPANVSGNNVFEVGTIFRTDVPTVITSLSGGTELSSGVTFAVTIRNASGNAPMYLGGTGTYAPFSGKGMVLFGGESKQIKIDNFNKLRVFANTSGQKVYLDGQDK